MTRRSITLLPRANRLMLILLLATFPVHAQEPAWDMEQRVVSSSDDSEEFLANSADDPERWPAGFSYAESSDLELGRDASHAPQVVGIRFADLQIPPGARIERAVLEFTADSDQAEPLALTITTQDAVATEPFLQDEDGQGSFDLTSRPTNAFRQTWMPEPWSEGRTYRSPDVSGLLQDLVNRDEWQSGRSVVLLLYPDDATGGGLRSAYSFDSNPQLAPRLMVDLSAADAEEADGAEPEAGQPADPVPAQREPGQPEPDQEEADQPEPDQEEAGAPAPAEAEQAEADDEQPAAVPEGAEEDASDVPEVQAEPEPLEPEPEDEAPADPGERQPVRVVPVDPDPILPPREGEAPQSVWPGPVSPDRQAEDGAAEAPEPAEEPEAGRLEEAAGAEGEERADEPRRERFPLSPSFDRGIRGSVLLSDYGSGVTVVTVFLDNPVATVTYPVSIRRGGCDSSGQLVVDLEPVVGTRAFSTTLLNLDFDQLVAGQHHLNVYRITDDFIRVSGCASLGEG